MIAAVGDQHDEALDLLPIVRHARRRAPRRIVLVGPLVGRIEFFAARQVQIAARVDALLNLPCKATLDSRRNRRVRAKATKVDFDIRMLQQHRDNLVVAFPCGVYERGVQLTIYSVHIELCLL